MRTRTDLRIFVVDDVPMIAHTLSAVLCDHGYSATPYTDPLRALRDVRKFAPNVLISDVQMPDLDGVDLAIQVQAQCPDCRVLLMSGHIGPIKSVETALDYGFQFPVLSKPVSALAIAERLEGFFALQSQHFSS
jgi:CheY-like chemotaxis protein